MTDVVLPCLNEAAALPWVLSRIPAGWRAIVVDNGSTDGSGDLARELGATVVTEAQRGFGAACAAGLRAATAELVCFCDCDGSLDPALLPQLTDQVTAGTADLVLGRRRPTTRGAWPLHARAGNVALARMLYRRTGVRLHDLGPMRAGRRAALVGLEVADRRSGYPLETVVRAADAGWRIVELPVPYAPRTGKSKVTGTWRGTWQAVHDMRGVLRTAPDVVGTAPGEGAGGAGGRGGSGGVGAGAGAGGSAGAGAVAGTSSGPGSGPEPRPGPGPGTGSEVGAGSEARADSGSGARAGTGPATGSGASAGSGARAGTGLATGSGASAGSGARGAGVAAGSALGGRGGGGGSRAGGAADGSTGGSGAGVGR